MTVIIKKNGTISQHLMKAIEEEPDTEVTEFAEDGLRKGLGEKFAGSISKETGRQLLKDIEEDQQAWG